MRDCTVSCSGAGDCAAGQVCGGDHLCAAPEVAGHCDSHTAGDTPADAATHGLLTIAIVGHGSVVVRDLGRCDYVAQPCELHIPLAAGDIMVEANGTDGWSFEAWSAGSCAGRTDRSCTFPPSVEMIATASFSKDTK